MELENVVQKADFAFQPIIESSTGVTLGYELLLRCKCEGFSISEFFDSAFKNGSLHRIDLILREKALTKIILIPFYKDMVFFYNIDNRILLNSDYEPGKTEIMIEKAGISNRNFCFEISEKHEIKKINYHKIFSNYKNRSFLVALDDYGSGFSGMKNLYNFEPDFIKIDRFLVTNIFNDPKKRLLMTSLVNMAHKMGIKVIAEGVQTEHELFACQECGCDFVQGYFIQKPTLDISELRNHYQL